jgi:hypothetical protein
MTDKKNYLQKKWRPETTFKKRGKTRSLMIRRIFKKNDNMKKVLILGCVFLLTSLFSVAQPNLEWTKSFNGQQSMGDDGRQIIQLPDGNIVAAGNMVNFATETALYYDTYVVKLSPNGVVLAEETINLDDYLSDEIVKMTADEFGNMYMAVKSLDYGSNISTVEIYKYNSALEQIWHTSYAKTDTTCIVADMVLDNENNIVVAASVGTILFSDIYLLKFDNDGDLIHSGIFTSADIIFRTAVCLATDNINNYYIGGHQTISDINYSYTDMLLVKFNSTGNLIWNRVYDGPINMYDFATVVKTDNDNNIYFAGVSEDDHGGGPEGDFALLKYNTDGDTIWTRRYDGGFGGDWPVAMVIDNAGNCYVTGWTISENGSKSTTVLKYSPSGNIEWTYTYDGVGYYFNDPYDIGLFPNGNILIIGATQPDMFPTDWNIICLNSEGNELWRETFTGNGTSNQWNLPLQLLIVSNSEFYVIGFADIDMNDSDMLIAKYSEGNTSVDEIKFFSEIRLYPNPATTFINIVIEGTASNPSEFIIKIYDVHGRIIDNQKFYSNEFQLNVSKLTKGIYLYEIISVNSIRKTGRFIVE